MTALLGELMELARLEAGQEKRELGRFNATTLASQLSRLNQPFARERGLFLRTEGPGRLFVEGDSLRVRRLLQNLVINALRYTHQGGVVLSWGVEKKNWWLMVKDTGPGLQSGSGAAMAEGLGEATASARESDVKTAALAGATSQVLTPDGAAPVAPRPTSQQPGEGIGLSIVKRLCELLDASLEIASSVETGTTFRAVFPRRYSAGTRQRPRPPAAR
jgi:signal transduction histidine kinase